MLARDNFRMAGDLIGPGEVLVFDLELVRVVELHWGDVEGVYWWHVCIALLVIVCSFKYLIAETETRCVANHSQFMLSH